MPSLVQVGCNFRSSLFFKFIYNYGNYVYILIYIYNIIINITDPWSDKSLPLSGQDRYGESRLTYFKTRCHNFSGELFCILQRRLKERRQISHTVSKCTSYPSHNWVSPSLPRNRGRTNVRVVARARGEAWQQSISSVLDPVAIPIARGWCVLPILHKAR